MKLGIENRQYVEAVTEDEKFVEAWRKRGAMYAAIKRVVIEDIEGCRKQHLISKTVLDLKMIILNVALVVLTLK